jgi:alpha/beta superfamily hydrolase
MKTSEFDKNFDEGEDISAAIDWSKARRLNTQTKRVNVDFPIWVVDGLDNQATHLGITRQALIKVWIAEKLA